MLLTILMPCLDEEKTVGACVATALESLRALGISGEVLIADNGSADRSVPLAQEAGARVIHVAERGYGAAIRAGIAAAAGERILMGDCDSSYDFGSKNIARFMRALEGGAELVMGNRFKGGIAAGAMPWLHKLATPAMTLVFNLLYRTPVGDLNCGMRAFNTAKFRALDLQSSGMEFASEMLVRSAQAKLRIVEIPTTLAKDGRGRKPHLKSFSDGWRHMMVWLRLYR